jgi:phenylalanyl-tRNA synthetase alpha chain
MSTMRAQEIAASLHPLEIRVLEISAESKEFTDQELKGSGQVSDAQVRTVIEWQLAKDCLAVVETVEHKWVELTELGQSYSKGTPELRLVARLREVGEAPVAELQQLPGLDPREAGAALGVLKAHGIVTASPPSSVKLVEQANCAPIEEVFALIRTVGDAGRIPWDKLTEADRERIESASRKRGKSKGIFRIGADTTRRLRFTELGLAVREAVHQLGRRSDELNELTPEMLTDGNWRDKTFRRYSLDIKPPRRVAGRRHPYREFLDFVRRTLIGLGFEEMRGELVETEFWNMDALFMPQFHAARDIHDVYFVKEPTHADKLDEPFASRVASAHANGFNTGSRGWGYTFDSTRARRLVLRSQGTVLSARWLQRATVPGKYFAIARCFRYDQVDATHAPDFFQCEGIVLGERIDFVTLLGLLRLFAEEVAKAKDVRFAPAYFPFTEPSVEVHIRHPEVGWMELGGAGIFRPEVTVPQGVKVPVIAWGLGLDRMAMMALGIKDIRELFSLDLNQVRNTRVWVRD